MADQVDYRALYEKEVRHRKEVESRLEDERRAREEERRAREDTEKQLAKTTFLEFLDICHHNIFLKLKVQRNELLATTGGLTRVDGKLYPRILRPWPDFDDRLEASFAALEQTFQQQPPLFPSPAGLGYLATKLSDKKLASEEDLKNFECLAVEGCALDVLPRFLELVHGGEAAIPNADMPTEISFNNYPFGVITADSDEVASEAEPDQDEANPSPIRGRSRTRASRSGGRSRKPLRIKPDAEGRARSGPPRKRPSPERTKVRPGQWCFRHGADGTSRPLFVIEYKAAHKIDGDLLRQCLEPEAAASLMEDTIRSLLAKKSTDTVKDKDKDDCDDYDNDDYDNYDNDDYDDYDNNDYDDDDDWVAKLDITKVFTQTHHYMVDYGLQYSYATTGDALIFFYLDPQQPGTLFYHLEEPKRTVHSTGRNDMKHSAVALVLAFVLIAITGQYLTQQWKKTVTKEQPRWPVPYADKGVATPAHVPRIDTAVTLPHHTTKEAVDGCGDPQKRDATCRRDQDDNDDDDASGPGPSSGTGGSAQAATSSTLARTRTTSTAQSQSASGGSFAAHAGSSTIQNARQQSASSPVWSLPVNAPLSPSLPYCTQACLLGLTTGGAKDVSCPNVSLHRRRDAAGIAAATGEDDDGRHPISAEAFRTLLVQQLAEDMDHDCHSLERFGMYGAIGALFKLALSTYGYCFVGKGVQRAHQERLAAEAAVYDVLEACQGRLVPVNLGVITLVDEYWTECGAHISHMMLMAYAGESLWHRSRKTGDRHQHREAMLCTLRELAPYGVVHGDVNNNNMAWNEELQRVMAIDLDHAQVEVHKTTPEKGTKQRTEQWTEQTPGTPASVLRKRREIPNQRDSGQHAKRTKRDVESKENAPHEEQR